MSPGQELLHRASERCERIGRSLKEVLAAAGVAPDFLTTRVKHGRRYDKLAAIARELRWTVAELMEEAAPGPAVDSALLLRALRIAKKLVARRQAGGDLPADNGEQLLVEITTIAYEDFARTATEGRPAPDNDAEAVTLLDAIITVFLRDR